MQLYCTTENAIALQWSKCNAQFFQWRSLKSQTSEIAQWNSTIISQSQMTNFIIIITAPSSNIIITIIAQIFRQNWSSADVMSSLLTCWQADGGELGQNWANLMQVRTGDPNTVSVLTWNETHTWRCWQTGYQRVKVNFKSVEFQNRVTSSSFKICRSILRSTLVKGDEWCETKWEGRLVARANNQACLWEALKKVVKAWILSQLVKPLHRLGTK